LTPSMLLQTSLIHRPISERWVWVLSCRLGESGLHFHLGSSDNVIDFLSDLVNLCFSIQTSPYLLISFQETF
jgi:hypothetical protein